MDRIESALQKYQQAGVPSSSTPPSVPPPRQPRLAPSRDQYHASPPPSPPPPAPRPSVHPYHAHQNSTNGHAESSTTSNGNSVGGSLKLEILAAYQNLERRKISDLVEQRKSLEKQLDTINKEIETRTRRLDEMESSHSERKAYRRLDFARPLPSSPPSDAPPPNRGTKRANAGVLDNILKRRLSD